MKQGQVELDEKGRPKYFGAGLAYGDVVRLYQEIGHDYFELQRRAIALKIKRTRRLAKELRPLEERMEEIGARRRIRHDLQQALHRNR